MEKNEITRVTVWQHQAIIVPFHFVRWWPNWVQYRIFTTLATFVTFMLVPSLRSAAIRNMS